MLHAGQVQGWKGSKYCYCFENHFEDVSIKMWISMCDQEEGVLTFNSTSDKIIFNFMGESCFVK